MGGNSSFILLIFIVLVLSVLSNNNQFKDINNRLEIINSRLDNMTQLISSLKQSNIVDYSYLDNKLMEMEERFKSNLVTLDTDQTITGSKIFTNIQESMDDPTNLEEYYINKFNSRRIDSYDLSDLYDFFIKKFTSSEIDRLSNEIKNELNNNKIK
jgi:hypothetical protein